MFTPPNARRTSFFHDPVALDLWDPFHHQGMPFIPPMPPLQFPRFPAEMAASPFTTAGVDWTQTPTAHVLKLDVPGYKREEVTIDLNDGGVLRITGEKRVEKEDRSDSWHHVERSSGRFTSSFTLPENCDPHEMEVSVENGVLTIKVPKVEGRHGRGKWTRIPVH
ncbi:hypothetical protein BT93_D1017 [Corymbia citriodora subsp. variegata]|nr:hypothetical protein BT93_D1017 [Corymbia citriodora subsp. variegata]